MGTLLCNSNPTLKCNTDYPDIRLSLSLRLRCRALQGMLIQSHPRDTKNPRRNMPWSTQTFLDMKIRYAPHHYSPLPISPSLAGREGPPPAIQINKQYQHGTYTLLLRDFQKLQRARDVAISCYLRYGSLNFVFACFERKGRMREEGNGVEQRADMKLLPKLHDRPHGRKPVPSHSHPSRSKNNNFETLVFNPS